ncbi:MAG TPA: hypothetical protein VK892_23925, partial [Pyrinomonadaceae bacterium]|nr:hypothetical protein [Pyrinomonadaceae bacterium]
MLRKFILAVLFVFTASLGLTVSAQNADVGINPNFAGGEVTSVDSAKIVLQTKDGVIEVVLSPTTQYKRVPPENPVLKAAVAASLTDIGVGDKLLVTGTVSADKKNIPAKAVYLLSKSDIAQKLDKERQAWRTRGITGRVTKVDFQTGEVTIAERAMTGERAVVISPKERAKYLRYAPNSVNYSEAKASSIKEIFIGDMVRALGDRSQEGTNFQAEIILSGAFQTV